MTRQSFARRHRRLLAIVVALGIGVGSAGVFAYFLAHGTGTSSSNVTTGAAPTLPVTVQVGAPSGGPLSPGSGSETLSLNIYNPNTVPVVYTVALSVRTGPNGGIYDTTSNAFVPGCKASWFAISEAITGPITQPANAFPFQDSILVTMPANTTTDQSICENLTPAIDVTAS